MEIVGQRLKALRESMGISQAKIALLLDSKQPNINRFEHNQSEPPLDYILGRTDQPQGKLYEYKPTYSPEREDMRRFIEMCFDPASPANAKLKETLLRMAEGENP